MAALQSIDPLAVLAALGVSDAQVVGPLAGGSDTALWRIERQGAPFALRVFRAQQVHTCRREVAAMRAAAAHGMPVPHVELQGSWQDRPALLLSWCRGRPLWAALRDQPWRVWQLGMAFGRVQARIHRVPPPDDLDPDPQAWIALAGADRGALQARVRELSQRGPPVLLHLDYHPLNVLAEGGRITGVLDWANARPGDRRADVARTLTILRLSPRQAGSPPRWLGPDEDGRVLRVGRQLLALGWRRGYEAEAGRLGDLAVFYAWAGAFMLADLGPRQDRPGGPPPRALEAARRWSEHWARRAGM
jgi:aminoglycoside phosphotransferase (APT) family kinase protein